MIRRSCAKHGHQWITSMGSGYIPSVQFCGRTLCSASRPDPTLDSSTVSFLRQSIMRQPNYNCRPRCLTQGHKAVIMPDVNNRLEIRCKRIGCLHVQDLR